jgi:hypothetical protein
MRLWPLRCTCARCFEAEWEADIRAWHLLLEDLT